VGRRFYRPKKHTQVAEDTFFGFPNNHAGHITHNYFGRYGLDPTHPDQVLLADKLYLHHARLLEGGQPIFTDAQLNEIREKNEDLGEKLRQERRKRYNAVLTATKKQHSRLVAIEEICSSDRERAKSYSKPKIPGIPESGSLADLKTAKKKLDSLADAKFNEVKHIVEQHLSALELTGFYPDESECPLDWDNDLDTAAAAYKICILKTEELAKVKRSEHRLRAIEQQKQIVAAKNAPPKPAGRERKLSEILGLDKPAEEREFDRLEAEVNSMDVDKPKV
jgi:hypothetical protein